MDNKESGTSMNDAVDMANAKVNQLAAMIQILANDEGRRDWDIDTEAWYIEACSMMAEQAKSAVNDMYGYI